MEETTEQQSIRQEAAQQSASAVSAEANEQSVQASAQPAGKDAKKRAKEFFKTYFTATRIAYIGVFTALSLALRFLQFSVLPAVPYLQLDFSDAFVFVCGYALGPVSGTITLVLKELIYGIIGSKTFFVGELANVVITLPFLLITSLIYKKHKGIKAVLVGMAIACTVRVLWSFPVNWLLNFPVFVGFDWPRGMSMFLKVWYWAMLFNLIKTVVLAAVVMLLYKPLSRLIQLTSEKFDRRKKTA